MFHRVPSISFMAVVTSAFILLLVVLFASSLSSPEVALAGENRASALSQDAKENHLDQVVTSDQDAVFDQHMDAGPNPHIDADYLCDPDNADYDPTSNDSCPQVSIYAVMPEVGEENTDITVTLRLSRPLVQEDDLGAPDVDEREKYCFTNTAPPNHNPEVCIEGGIIVWDTYDDHLYEVGGPKYDNGFIPSNEWIKFVFRNGEVEKRLTYNIADDECITPERAIRIVVNTAFIPEDYGYTIDTSESQVIVNGNDEENGEYIDSNDHSKGECGDVEEGATEEFIGNHAPQFSSRPPTIEVPENKATNQPIGDPVTANDPENDMLTYSLKGTDPGSFNIDSSSGQIRTKDALDYETEKTYHVAVFVRDSKDIHGNPDAVEDNSIDVTINVTDVNEKPQFDPTAPTTLSVVENTSAGTDIGIPITATDPDNTGSNPNKDTLTYSLDDGDGASFEIDSSGQIKTKGALDREAQATYAVTVSVTDGKDASGSADTVVDDTRRVTITVDNEVEPPTFNDGDSGTPRSVAENTPDGRPVGDPVAASSEDGGTLTYSLTGTDASSFDIDTDTGQIKTKNDLDYEDRDSYQVTVSVTDSKDAQGNPENPGVADATITVTIDVTDVNEPPQFDPNAATTIEISEDTAPGVNVGNQYEATDPDNDTLAYTLDSASTATFEIDANGQLRTKVEPDHETEDSHTVIISVSDSKDAAGDTDTASDDTITVTITVTNVFEAPRFDDDDGSGTTTRSVLENTAADQNIGLRVSATDDEDDTLTYSLGGTDVDSFDFDTATGQIKTKEALNHETKEFYSVIVSVADGKAPDGTIEDPAQTDTEINVTIEIEDVNELPEFIANLPTELSVPENTTTDTDIDAPFTATDEDENETLTYSLTGTDAASFAIDETTGQIKTLAALNHETKETYRVTVSVSDGRDNGGDDEQPPVTDATLDITITVTDADDPGTITFPVAPPSAGTTITAVLEDQDGIKTDVVVTWVWEISSDPTDQTSWETIDGATTDSYIPQEEDIGDTLRVTATYDDEFDTGQTAWDETAAVLEKEATNLQPSFADTPATRSILENTAPDESIGNPVAATPSDSVGTLVYSLDTTGATSFDIDSETGQLKTKIDLDYETTPYYTVTVSVSDGMDDYRNADTVVDDTIEVTINVIDMMVPDIPEAPTVEAAPGAAAKLNVSWAAVTATDSKPVDGYDVQYRVKDTTDTAPWLTDNVTVSGASATITGLEYSTTYEVQVRSKNAEGDSAWSPTGEGTIPSSLSVSFSPASQTVTEGNSATFTVTVSPAADRGLSIPISVTRGSAESGDYSVSGTPLSFVSGETSETFTISTTDDDDRDDETLSIGFGSLPTAVGTGSQSTASLTINDTTPAPPPNISSLRVSFEQASYTVTEGSSRTITVNVSPAADRTLSIPISITRGSAESGDYSVSGTPLSFASGDTSKTFTISTTDDDDRDDETLSVRFGSLPAAVGTGSPSTASLTINDTTPAPRSNTGGGGGGGKGGGGGGGGSYIGGSSYGRSSSNPPVYSGPPPNNSPSFYEGVSTHRSVEENSGSQTAIGSPVSASDGDNDSLTYQLSGLDGASFDINADTGQILSKSVLDFEVQSAYYVFVTVSDGKGGSARISVTIFVIDVDETPDPVPVAQLAVPTPEPTPVPPPTEIPTPEPTETPTPEPTAVPTPTAVCPHLRRFQRRYPRQRWRRTLAPTPTAVPTPTLAPTPTAQPTPTVTPEPQPELPGASYQPKVQPPEIVDLGNANGASDAQVVMTVIPEDLRKFRIWPIILLVLGAIMELVALSMFLKEREADKRKFWSPY